MKIVKFEGIELHIDESNTLSTKEVAQGYGISPSVVRTHKSLHSDELIENVHYIVKRDDKNRVVIRWTLEGVHMLGFFIKSERAKEFRKFTAKLLTEIKKGNVQVSVAPPQNCPAADNMSTRIAGYKGQLALKKKQIEEMQWRIIQLEEELKECKQIDHRQIMLEHNILDLAGGYARLREEILGSAEALELVANSLKERIKTIDHFIKGIERYMPAAKDVAKTATKHAKTNNQWMMVSVKQKIKGNR